MTDLERLLELNPLVTAKIETPEHYDEWKSLKSKLESQLEKIKCGKCHKQTGTEIFCEGCFDWEIQSVVG